MIAVPSKEAMQISNDALDKRGGNNSVARDRLDSWKEIAAYLRRSVRCVQRWERTEGLPVLRHRHAKGATVSPIGTKSINGGRKEGQLIVRHGRIVSTQRTNYGRLVPKINDYL